MKGEVVVKREEEAVEGEDDNDVSKDNMEHDSTHNEEPHIP
jgi:hypothetical protein